MPTAPQRLVLGQTHRSPGHAGPCPRHQPGIGGIDAIVDDNGIELFGRFTLQFYVDPPQVQQIQFMLQSVPSSTHRIDLDTKDAWNRTHVFPDRSPADPQTSR